MYTPDEIATITTEMSKEMKILVIVSISIIIIMIIGIVVAIVISKKSEHMCNTNQNLKAYITSNDLPPEQSKKIKLKWVDPITKMVYYLGAVPKTRIDQQCTMLDYMNKNALSEETLITPDRLLILVNERYIQANNCGNNCVSSKLHESFFDFIWTQPIDRKAGNTINKLTYIPKNGTDKTYIMTYAKNADKTGEVGVTQEYGDYLNYLSLVEQSEDTLNPPGPGPKSKNTFYIESILNSPGFKIYFDNVPVYDSNHTNIIASSKQFVGVSTVSACNNVDCTAKCGSHNASCMNCCSDDHRFLYLYDSMYNNKDPLQTMITVFVPEHANIFSKRTANCKNDCAVQC